MDPPRTRSSARPPSWPVISAVGLNSSSANWSMARGASASTKAVCSWSGPNRRVAVSYSRPVKTRPEAGEAAEIRTSQILSNVGSNLEKASALSVSRLPLASGLGVTAMVMIQGGPTKRRTWACHCLSKAARRAWSIRAEGSNER